ncbi:MAG: VCBS repeat-containing protein, partial [FCB group bacterium]|nr:VCBS repeat-containing protein [FCB group bacterium]
MKKLVIIFVLLPLVLSAQDLLFELEPEAFPVTIEGCVPHSPWSGGINASTPEFCDIDADGDLDYFSGSLLNYFWHFRNVGNNTAPDFEYVTSYFDSLYPVGIGILPESDIEFTDIDADGDQDVFISNGIIGIVINQGSLVQSSFPGPVDTLFDQNGDYILGIYFAIVDVDADGDQDIIGGFQSASDYSLRYYENIGTPTQYEYYLTDLQWQGIQTFEGRQHPCFGDLDNDGDFDMLIGVRDGTLYYYRNDGTPTSPQMTLVSDNYLDLDVGDYASPELADIDGDGDLDLFVGRSPDIGNNMMGNVYYFENVGSASVPDFQFVTINYLSFDIGSYAKPRLVDIDADGDPDLFTDIKPHIGLFRNHGSLQEPNFVFETETFEDIYEPGANMPWFADIDGDNDYDLFV